MTALIEGIPVEDGMTGQVDERDYHRDKGSLSVSGMKLLLKCPAKFKAYVDNPPPPRAVFDFGHLVHRQVLGDGPEIVVLEPAVHGLKKDGTIADNPTATTGWKDAVAEARARGAIPVHVDDFVKAKAMAEIVHNDQYAGPLFQRGHAEKSFYWTDPATGVRLRARTDWLTLMPSSTGEQLVCVDYKTAATADPAEIEHQFYRYGYYMQAAHYSDMIKAVGLSDDPAFKLVVQEKQDPYVVQVVNYDDEALAAGRRKVREAIDLYVQCTERDEWPYYVDGEITIGLPMWADESMEIAV